jgi:hypothetical protein
MLIAMLLKKDTLKGKLLYQRWLDRLFLMVAAGTICYFFSSTLKWLANKTDLYMSIFPTWGIYLFFLMICILARHILHDLGGFRFKDIINKRSLYNPPIWIIGLLGTSILYLIMKSSTWKNIPDVVGNDSLWLFPGTVIFCFLTKNYNVPLSSFISKRLSEHPAQSSNISMLLDPENLIKWIEEEKPIEHPNQDYFDHKSYAKRIAKYLCGNPTKTIGLIGSYGCGKSSIRNMVEYYLQEKEASSIQKIIPCTINAWGVRDESITEFILKNAIKEVTRYTDCIDLMRIPARYIAFLSSTDSRWSNITSALLSHWKSAEELLSKLDETLDLTQYRLVIYLEDIDRNFMNEESKKDIYALLDRLKECKNITFVFAIGSDSNTSLSLTRIAEHIETVSQPQPSIIIQIIRKVREYCLNWNGANADIRCKLERDQKDRLDIDNWEYLSDVLKYIGKKNKTETDETLLPITAITLLLSNPRTMKLALRRSWYSWNNLHGEIDIDDLLVTNVLRHGAPEVFDLLLSQHGKIEKPKALLNEINEYYPEESWKGQAVIKLMQFLFPSLDTKGIDPDEITSQGVFNSKAKEYGIDYWQRIVSEEIPEDSPKDQDVLRTITLWKQTPNANIWKNTKTFPQAIVDKDLNALHISNFHLEFDDQELRKLTSEVFQYFLKLKREKAGVNDLPWFREYFNNSWTYIRRPNPIWKDGELDTSFSFPYHEIFLKWIDEEIVLAIPISLRFAVDLFKEYRIKLHQESDSQNIKSRSKFLKKMNTFYSDPQTLISVINPKDFTIMKDLLESVRLPNSNDYPPELETFISLFISAGKMSPQVIIPQIVGIRYNNQAPELNEQIFNKVFEKHGNDVCNILIQPFNFDDFDMQDHSQTFYVENISKMQDWAKNILKIIT